MAAQTDPPPPPRTDPPAEYSARLARMIASGFGLGYLPKAPGTWGSLAACIIAWPITIAGGPIALLVAAGCAFGIGLWASGVCLRQNHNSGLQSDPDPSWIVIDEIAGQWLTLVIAPLDPLHYALGFSFFRSLDILKLPPIDQAESWPGPLGIMADDIVAGAAAATILWGFS